MEQSTRATGRMTYRMVKELKVGQMVQSMKEVTRKA